VTGPVRAARPARPFAGRARELHAVAACLARLQAGQGGAILVSGEPGIGKTSLAGQVESRAADLGVPVAWGSCADDEGAPPLWPWRQILAGCAARAAPGGSPRDPPSRILPGVAGQNRAGAAAPPPDGSERFRLFESLTADVTAAAAAAGLVVVLDDLQWADPMSAMLLAHLGRDLPASRVLLVAAYRDQELSRNAPAQAAVAALVREPGTVQLRLAGLAEAEVADQLEATFGRRFDLRVVAGVASRTGGNPFFVAELGRLVNDAAPAGQAEAGSWLTELPEGVRAVIGQRLARLPASCRDVLSTAAVIAPTIDVRTVAAAGGLTPEIVLAGLDTAGAAGLVRAAAGEPAEFSHALVRDVIRAEVPPSRQFGMHRRAAEHLEAAYAADLDRHAGGIAHHWLSAGPLADAAHAVGWAERAAAVSMRSLAYEEAARLCERALRVTGPGALTGTDRGRLLLARAEALYKAGDVNQAITAAGQAGDEAQRRGDPAGMARAALILEGVTDQDWGRRVVHLAETALRQLGHDNDELSARLLAAIATAQSASLSTGNTDEAGPLSLQSLALAEAAGTPAALVSALRARQLACAGPDGVGDRLNVAERMLALAAEHADPWAGLWGRLWRIEARCQLGAIDAAESDLDELADVTRQLSQPVASWHLARTRCALAMARGHFEAAEGHLDDAVRLAAQGLDARAWQIRAIAGAKLASLTGDPRHEHWFATLEQEAGPSVLSAGRWGILVVHYAGRGDLERARALYRKLPPWQTWQPPRFVALVVLDLRARAAALLGDADGAAIAYARLRPWARYFVVGGTGVVAIDGSAEHTLGCLAACLGKPDTAVRHLRAAIAANQRAGLPPSELQSRYELAKVLARRSRREDRSEALVLAGDAARGAARLGMAPLRADAEHLSKMMRNGDSGPVGLTRREREIAELVGRGLTNRQIADVLHVAERTAENHVQHILTKLGFHNRSQIAAWAARTTPDGTAGR
jgi:DNA-binding CsgD family transcriptional regulator/tetratricopeptide (TPR) repeat protein